MSKALVIISLLTMLMMSAGAYILVQSLEKEKMSMPDLTGEDVNYAMKLLTNVYRISKITVDSLYHDQYKRNTIVAFDPKAGTRLSSQTRVRIVYARGRETCPKCREKRKDGARVCHNCGYVYK